MSHFFGKKSQRNADAERDGDVATKDISNHVVVDVATVEPGDGNRDIGIGETTRALKHRHLQMIGIGGGEFKFPDIGPCMWKRN